MSPLPNAIRDAGNRHFDARQPKKEQLYFVTGLIHLLKAAR